MRLRLKSEKHDVVPGFSFQDVSCISVYHALFHSTAQPESQEGYEPMHSSTAGGLIERIMMDSHVGNIFPGTYCTELFGPARFSSGHVFPTRDMCRHFLKRGPSESELITIPGRVRLILCDTSVTQGQA